MVGSVCEYYVIVPLDYLVDKVLISMDILTDLINTCIHISSFEPY